MAIIVLNENFEKTSELEIPESFKNINAHNLYLYVKAFLSNKRAGNAHTKTRSDVRGGGKKPWSQKGRGGARAGSKRSPVFVGGGVAFGPKNKANYFQKVNKKQQLLALKYVFNELAEQNKLFIVDSVKIDSGKTKDANELFKKLEAKKAVIVAGEETEENAKTFLAFRNLETCNFISEEQLNAYTANNARAVVLEKSVWENISKEG
jgi:large subunit ribosomal protein L4